MKYVSLTYRPLRLYGMACLQTYIVFKQKKGRMWLRSLVRKTFRVIIVPLKLLIS